MLAEKWLGNIAPKMFSLAFTLTTPAYRNEKVYL